MSAAIGLGGAALVAALALMVSAGPAGAAGSLKITFVTCSSSGYSFVVSGTGFAPNTTIVVWDLDNLHPGPPPGGQFYLARTDASGVFSSSVTTGSGQVLPATVLVTSGLDGLTTIAGPITAIPPDCSTLSASAASIVANGTTASTISLQTRNPDGSLVGAAGSGRAVRFSTSTGTFPSGCASSCLATDNGNGTYSLPLTSSATPGTAVVSATVSDPTYGTVPVKNTASVVFTSTTVQASTTTSTIGVNPSSTAGNGTDTVAVTIQTKNSAGANLTTGGVAVTVSTTAGTFSGGCTVNCPATDNGDGTYSATLISPTTTSSAITATITGQINGAAMSHSTTASFSAASSGTVSAAASTISVSPSSVLADGTSTVAVTVQTKDSDGNNLTTGGATVTVTTSAGTFPGGCMIECPAIDNGDGTYSLTLTAPTDPGTAAVLGAIAGTPLGTETTVTFTSTGSGGGGTGGGGSGSAQALKQLVLQQVLTLSSTRQPDNDKLHMIAADLTDALTLSNWTGADGNHLNLTTGDQVFNDEHDAVQHLVELISDPGVQIANARVVLWPLVVSLVQADKALASTAVTEAGCASCDRNQYAHANTELGLGNTVPLPATLPPCPGPGPGPAPGPKGCPPFGPGPNSPVDAITHYTNAWDAAEQAIRFPCTAVGEVNANGHVALTATMATAFGVTSGTSLSFDVEGDCDSDNSAPAVFLDHAHVNIGNGPPATCPPGKPGPPGPPPPAPACPPGPPNSPQSLVGAQTDRGLGHRSVTSVVITGTTAVVSGTWNGQAFTVTLHDGGKGAASDTARIQLGSADTGVLALLDGNVSVDNT